MPMIWIAQPLERGNSIPLSSVRAALPPRRLRPFCHESSPDPFCHHLVSSLREDAELRLVTGSFLVEKSPAHLVFREAVDLIADIG